MPPTPPNKSEAYGSGPQAPRPQVVSPKIWVERTFPTGSQFEEQNLEARVFATTPAMVSAKIGRTVNTGDYESIRIEVGVSLPCYAEEVEQGITTASEMVGKFVADEEAAVRQMLAKKSKKTA